MATDPLVDALKRNIAARYSATETLTLIFGPVEDIPNVISWVAADPNPAAASDDVDRETQRLRDFERGLLDHLTWKHPGGGW